MNMNQLMSMFTRLVARRAMNWGINKGMDQLSRRNAPPADPDAPSTRQPKRGNRQNKQGQDLARKMRTLGRLTRR
ncbi:hypothetical protein D3P06_13625 [Paracoccus aestuarii]|uniref:Uncharacterized protein n=1 Tax=Paracoccus aestuarii TaxID=453842 RepID=A0A418ZSE5_9RHOB|nr:hypothetical protein [Paracoccus aestuarii]RJL00312.1 hypothetical protein D3P06_13625 [Paracoccus aestuarii]WCQ99669.1 hypothetical protein JHW48_02695 [Paracoccus aestuarii]